MEPADAAIIGTILGAVLGSLADLGVNMWISQRTLLFSGDTILIGAVLCALPGYVFG